MSINTVEYANQLLAENADLKKQVQELKSRLQLVSELNDAAAALHVEAEKQVQALAADNHYLLGRIDWPKEQCPVTGAVTDVQSEDFIPDTDAILNEVRAQAVEGFAKDCDDNFGLV